MSDKLYVVILGGTIFTPNTPDALPVVRPVKANDVDRSMGNFHGAVYEKKTIKPDGTLAVRQSQFRMMGEMVVGTVEQLGAFMTERLGRAAKTYDEGEAVNLGSHEAIEQFQAVLRKQLKPDGKAVAIPFNNWVAEPFSSADKQKVLDLIRRRQSEMPPHLYGLIHNADWDTTCKITAQMAKDTGCDLIVGDLWVYVDPNDDKFVKSGYVTRAGEIAIHKLEEKSRGQEAKEPIEADKNP